MLIADVYQILIHTDPTEVIRRGDQFKLARMSDDFWGPCDSFVGKKITDVCEGGKVQFRRFVGHEVQV